MNATPEDQPNEKQKEKMKYLAMQAASKGPCNKNFLTCQANWHKMPTKWIHRVVNELILEGLMDVYRDSESKKRGPKPQMFKLTDDGYKEFTLMEAERLDSL